MGVKTERVFGDYGFTDAPFVIESVSSGLFFWYTQAEKPTGDVHLVIRGKVSKKIPEKYLGLDETKGRLDVLESRLSNSEPYLLPIVSDSDNGKVLTVVNGQWQAVSTK